MVGYLIAGGVGAAVLVFLIKGFDTIAHAVGFLTGRHIE